MNLLIVLALLGAVTTTNAASHPTTTKHAASSKRHSATTSTTKEAPQEACLPEKDPASPRKSKLATTKPSKEIVRLDLDNDGDPDVLEAWLNGERCRWIDENDDMRWSDTRGDQSMDAMQIDRDGDGYYDGPEDLNIKWGDDNSDGRADVQCFAANPSTTQKSTHGGTSHWMIFIDVDQDGVNGYIDWTNFEFHRANWRVPPTTSPWHTIPPPNFSPDYMGNAIFLKQHEPAWTMTDPRFNWENPFAFYDFDGDGCTEMSIRLLDTAKKLSEDPKKPSETYTGFANEAMGGFDLDNDSSRDNEFDFDMSIKFSSDPDGKKGERIDYRKYRDKHKSIKAPQWVIDAKLFRYDNWRKIDEFAYVTHERCFEEMWKTKWASCWLVFDEDDDDHRWERVELYYPTTQPYSTARYGKDRKGGGLDGHGQSDTLGDRGEWDEDNSGRGKLYIGGWDQKLHLFGAESGAWSVDEHAKYWGSWPVLGNSSPTSAPSVKELVQYRDTDGNGYFDEITYDYDGDQKVDLKINLLAYATKKNPHPDVRELHNPAKLKWQGLHELYGKMSSLSFQEGLLLYRAAWKKGITTPQIDDLAFASSIGERYDHGYWLKEKIFRIVDRKLAGDPAKQSALRRAYFTHNLNDVVAVIETLEGESRWQPVTQPTTKPTTRTTHATKPATTRAK